MTRRTAQPSPEVRRARTAFLWVGLIVPLTILSVTTVVIAAWLPELPDPVAIHWGTEGVDGYGARWMVFFGPLVGIALVLLCAVLALFAHRMPQSSLSGGGLVADEQGKAQWSTTARMLGAVNLALSALLATLALATTAVQRGLADAAQSPDITLWVFVGFAAAVVCALVGWFSQPRVRAVVPPASSPQPLPLREGERAAWFGTVALARSGRITLGVGLLFTIAATVFMFAQPSPGGVSAGAWIMAAVCVLLVVGVACGLLFRVRVGADGLQVRSFLGWPNTRIPLADIAKVEVVRINPFAEFGGWGWRLGMDGRRGVVLRAGEALQITRVSGPVFVVTVDGAAEAATALEALRAGRGGAAVHPEPGKD